MQQRIGTPAVVHDTVAVPMKAQEYGYLSKTYAPTAV